MANETLKRKNSEDISPLNAKKPHIQDKNGANEKDSANNAPSLTNLPNEIIGKITDLLSFKDLFHLERVNKRMREISLNVAWPRKQTLDKESINFSMNLEDGSRYNNKVSDMTVESILSRANIKYLDLSTYPYKITSEICFQLTLAPQLIKLNLSNIELNNESLKNIAISCPLLEYATFPGCWRYENLDDGLGFFFKRCSNLKYLDLTRNKFSGDCLAYIPTKIRYLNLYFCDNVTSKDMEIFSTRANDLETLIMHNFKPTKDVNFWLKNLTKLRFLQLSGLKGNSPSLDFSDLKDLEMLCIKENSLVTIQTIKSLQRCPNLKGLDLRFNKHFAISDALKELESCKNLKYCDFSWLKILNDDLFHFVQNMKLEYLAINECHNIPDHVLKLLITDCDSLCQLEILECYKARARPSYIRALSSALSQKCLQRSNILKLIVEKEKQTFSSNEWCEVVYPGIPSFFIAYAIRDNKTSL